MQPFRELGAHLQSPSTNAVGMLRMDDLGRTVFSAHLLGTQPQAIFRQWKPVFLESEGGRIPNGTGVLGQEGAKGGVQVRPETMPAPVLGIRL